jgi:hypothetical protein
MSSADYKIIIPNDDNFKRILENIIESKQPRNIHYYAAGSIVHNYFSKKLMSDSNVSDGIEEQFHPTTKLTDSR